MKTVLLSPSGKDYIWGGTRLKQEFGKAALPQDPLAETWECSIHPDGPSLLASGPERGMTLATWLGAHPDYLGSSPSVSGGVPILVKLIDARSKLSVQVHPDDVYAAREENGQAGKTEMWYVVDADPGARLVYGLKRASSREELRESIGQGRLEQLLQYVPVRRGDVFFIPAGTIHAIGEGLLIAEIQQNSNLTYRLYDYGRLGKDGRPRELHVEKSLEVADLSGGRPVRQPMRLCCQPGFSRELLSRCRYFQVERCRLRTDGVTLPALPESFRVLLCLEGGGVVQEGSGTLRFSKGNTLFIPATAPDLKLSGQADFLLVRC